MRYSCDQIAGVDGWFQKAMFITIFKTDNIAIPRSLYCRAPSVTDMELDAVGREFKLYDWQHVLLQRLKWCGFGYQSLQSSDFIKLLQIIYRWDQDFFSPSSQVNRSTKFILVVKPKRIRARVKTRASTRA